MHGCAPKPAVAALVADRERADAPPVIEPFGDRR
jgi:hypothetical protein